MADKQNKVVSTYPKWLANDLCKATDLTLRVSDFNDYRHIPLYPTVEDITGRPITVRPNCTVKAYTNCDEYLGTFFRLMRGDYISVVRKTINEVVHCLQNDVPINQNLWYFNNVNIVCNKNSSDTMYLQFDTYTRASMMDYENSNKFKNGALLFLSNNKFITFTLGTVTCTKKLNKGIVGVDVIDFNEIKKWNSIDLLEPPVFYEPFRYVMAVFQDMSEDNFPMKNYIVYSNKLVSFPGYLKKNSIYTINGITFDILNSEWPSARVLHMDVHQYEALRGALTKEFALIQGPPGTGKTYIGLEIVKIIIENMYETKTLTHPILVVCMTNHALDNFLEGIWRITNRISRFGRSNSDILVNFIPPMGISRQDRSADVYARTRRNILAVTQEESVHVMNIFNIEKNHGILDLSILQGVLSSKNVGMWFLNSYDLVSWLLHGIPHVNGTNPIDFITENKLLSSELANATDDRTKNNIYCLSLKSIKLNRIRVFYQLNNMDINFSKGFHSNIKQNLELELEILNTVEEYMKKNLKLYMSGSDIECDSEINPDSLTERERWLLYYKWVELYLTQENDIIENLNDVNRQNTRDMMKVKSIRFLDGVKNKYVVGMTTTAAAKNRYLLKNLKCPIVIIEEAAEVLEPHIVASLSKYCEHLILIGDHQQLRPRTASVESKNYNLDVSLFERMVNNKIPSYVLTEQHRMRPEIAGLVAPAIYPHLRNHPSVKQRPHVRGVGMDVFCVTSCAHEEKNDELLSFFNSFEAKFLVALASYLLKQNYYPEEITILTMYNAQLAYISELIDETQCAQLKAIRLSAVDGYQGEENEIVLLSLVRSNDNNTIGFLSNKNRVCVALSRARCGFYIVGNLDLLAQTNSLWHKVKAYLKTFNAIGPKLTLKCSTHGNVLGRVSNELDFKSLPSCESICISKMMNTLSCGRLFKDDFRAQDSGSCPSVKKYRFGNQRNETSYEDCNTSEVVSSKLGVCAHTVQSKFRDVDTVKCQMPVKVFLKCGHLLEKKCYQPSICEQMCNKRSCNFGHPCKHRCGLPCGPCTQFIPAVFHCEHVSVMLCSSEQSIALCEKCSSRNMVSVPSLTYPHIPENMQ